MVRAAVDQPSRASELDDTGVLGTTAGRWLRASLLSSALVGRGVRAFQSIVRVGQSASNMDDMTAAKLAFLTDRASYPDEPLRVETRGTHFAWVFLTGERAYRMKKLSHLRGAGWRTREGRELACREELRGIVAQRQVVVLDDLCASGGTLVRAAEICRHATATAVRAAVTHAPLPAGLTTVLAAASLARVVVTDSVGFGPAAVCSPGAASKLTVLSVGPLFGQVLRRMLDGKPLAPLFERWPISAAD